MEEHEIKHLLGKRIKEFRKKKGLSQFALGEAIDINQRQVAQIEGGYSFPSLPTLNKLSKYFQIEIQEFFDFEHLRSENDLRFYVENCVKNANLDDLQKIYKFIRTL